LDPQGTPADFSALMSGAAELHNICPMLLGDEHADAFRASLQPLLAAASRRDGDLDDEERRRVSDDVIALANCYESTRSWLFQRVVGSISTFRSLSAGFQVLPGGGEPTILPRFVCPKGDYTWYRDQVGVSIPRCPAHAIGLVPAPGDIA
jgi:hypothetical protein